MTGRADDDLAGERSPLWLGLLSHAVLMVVAVVVLYPVLWVVRMALSPSQAFASGGERAVEMGGRGQNRGDTGEQDDLEVGDRLGWRGRSGGRRFRRWRRGAVQPQSGVGRRCRAQ